MRELTSKERKKRDTFLSKLKKTMSITNALEAQARELLNKGILDVGEFIHETFERGMEEYARYRALDEYGLHDPEVANLMKVSLHMKAEIENLCNRLD
jgi:hypothetical protein